MKYLASALIALLLAGCSDTVPEVGYLVDPSLTKISEKSFVQGDIAAASRVTASGYTGTIMVHAGNNARAAVTTDNSYSLSIRKISY